LAANDHVLDPIAPMARNKMTTLRRQPLLSEAIQAEVVKLIEDRRLEPGDALLTEGQLAEQLGVSRNSVREGVKALEVLGVIEARVGAGLFVSRFELQSVFENAPLFLVRGLGDVVDTVALRLYIESGMAEDLVERTTPDQLAKLRSIMKRWEVEMRKGSIAPELDRSFHLGVTGSIDNKLIRRILDAVWEVRHLAEVRGEVATADPVQNFARHARILQALEHRSVGMVREAIQRHYQEVLQDIQSSQARDT
jgi:DNA-binding FadR family transcriptional regulator